MSSRPFMIAFPFLRVGGRDCLYIDIRGSVSGVNSGLTELIIGLLGGERADSCVGGLFKSAPLIWAAGVIGVTASSPALGGVCAALQGVLDVTRISMHTHTHMCTHLQVAEHRAYISHPLRYDQFHLLACVQLSVQLLQAGEGSVSTPPEIPASFRLY